MLVTIAKTPNYLKTSKLYLSNSDENIIEVPFMKEDNNIKSYNDFILLLKTLQYWDCDDVPDTIFNWIDNNLNIVESNLKSLKIEFFESYLINTIEEHLDTYYANIGYRDTFVEPVEYAPIQFKDDNIIIEYTDCFEVSLLRFLHAVFITKKDNKYVMDIERMKEYMNDSNDLLDFFKVNNDIILSRKYYDNIKSDGYILRTLWCQFLNKNKFFKYKRYDMYEVCASLDNLFLFFKNYFPKVLLNDNDMIENKMNYIMKQLSTNKLKLSSTIESKTKINFDNIYYQNIIYININDTPVYEWMIYQYFNNDNNKFGKRITGHSDFRFQ
jgi:hypothetical protein